VEVVSDEANCSFEAYVAALEIQGSNMVSGMSTASVWKVSIWRLILQLDPARRPMNGQ